MRHIQPQICQHGFVVLFFLLSLSGKGIAGQLPGYSLTVPRSASLLSGLCVEIPCTFNVPVSTTLSASVTGIWRKKETHEIVAVSTDASKVSDRTKGRFTLTGKVHEGDCSFSISNIQPRDHGEYEFRFEDGNHKYSYALNKLSMIVTNLQAPTISPVRELIAGKQKTLTCTSHPAPKRCKGNITWKGTINIESSSNYEREDQSGRVTSISDITVTPSQRDHNISIICTVSYSGVSTNSSITLEVEYPPSVKITVPDSSREQTELHCESAGCLVEVIEGTPLSILCSAESNPPANLSWSKKSQNSIDPLNSSSGRLDVSNLKTDNKGDYMCEATNKYGTSTSSITVVITSHEKIISHLKILMIRGISILVLSGFIAMSAFLVLRYREKRRPPQQVEENKRSSPNLYQVVYSNTE